MGFGLSPDSFLLVVLGTQQRQVTSPASFGLPRWGCATETPSAPCSLCLRSEPAGRWCCHDESGGGCGERLHKSWCRCRCRPTPPGGSRLLPGRWAPFRPGRRWRFHPLPSRTIYHCRCGPHWKLCWIECCCWSAQSKGHRTASTNTKEGSFGDQQQDYTISN